MDDQGYRSLYLAQIMNTTQHSNRSQCARILKHLRRGRTLTHLQAERLFDCSRVSARILNLRNEGHRIDTEIVRTPSGKNVARYSLAK